MPIEQPAIPASRLVKTMILINYKSINEIHAELLLETSNSVRLELMDYLKAQSAEVCPSLEFGVYGFIQMSLTCITEKLVAGNSRLRRQVFIDPHIEVFNEWLRVNEVDYRTDDQDGFALRNHLLPYFEAKSDGCGQCAVEYSEVTAQLLSQVCEQTTEIAVNKEILNICRKHIEPFVERIKDLEPTYSSLIEEAGIVFDFVPNLSLDAQIMAMMLNNNSQHAIDNLVASCNHHPEITLSEEDIQKFRRDLMYYFLFGLTDPSTINHPSDNIFSDFAIALTKWGYENNSIMHQAIVEEIKAYGTWIQELQPDLEARTRRTDRDYVTEGLFKIFDSFSSMRDKVGSDLFDKIFCDYITSFETPDTDQIIVH